MEDNEVNFITEGLINGLGSTITLWLFWVPSVIFTVRPLMNAEVKQQICVLVNGELMPLIITQYNMLLLSSLKNLTEEHQITLQQATSLYDSFSFKRPTGGIPENVIQTLDESNQRNWDENLTLIIIFSILCVIIIFFSILGIIFLAAGQNLYDIFIFNLCMAFIILIIECVFFIVVTLNYIPYDLKNLLLKSEQNIIQVFM
jgi:hypothetical protein